MDNKQLDMVLEYLNTGSINEGFFDKFKKSKKPNKSDDGMKTAWEDNAEICEEIEKIEKKLITSSYKKSIVDDLNNALKKNLINDVDFKANFKYTTSNIPKFGAEGITFDGIQVIFDSSQDENSVLMWVLEDIVKELKKTSVGSFDFSTGDGDEGCIYFH